MIKITRGTNPTLTYTFDGITLTAGDDCFFTIRKSIEETGEPSGAGEFQMACNAQGEATDLVFGNVFKITSTTVQISLSRLYTVSMEYPAYFLQLNLKTSSGKYFTTKPEALQICFNIADIPGADSEE